MLDSFPENKPLYYDSGLWQMRSDDMENVIVQQSCGEDFLSFLVRCKLETELECPEDCKHKKGRHCLLGACHCIRRAEDYYERKINVIDEELS